MGDQSNGDATPPTRITEELLKDSIKEASGEDDVDIVGFTSKSAIPKGHNFTSSILAVDVEAKVGGSQETKTFNFIIKEAPFDNVFHDLLKESDIFVKEIRVYTEMLPALVDVQREYGVKDPVVVEAPGFYSSLKHPTCLVFENLALQGYRIGDKTGGLDYNHCRLVVKEVAKLHSLSYALKTRTGKPLKDLFPYLNDIFDGQTTTKDMFQNMMNNSYRTAINAMEIYDPSLATKMKIIDGKAFDTLNNIVQDTEGVELIGHSDLGLHNMMFKYEKQGDVEVPVAVKLLDFQVVRVVNPSVDLNLFLYTSATVEARRNHLQDILKLYHDTFVGTLRSMSLEYPEFTFERLQKKFRKDSLYGLVFGCLVLPVMMSAPEDALDSKGGKEGSAGEEFANRINDAAAKLRKNKGYKARLTSLVQEIHDAGLI